MKFLKNLSKAVPTKARWVFIVSIGVMSGILILVWRSMASEPRPPAPVQSGAVIESSIQKIKKARPDEVSEAPATSPMIKELQKDQDKKIQEAQTGDKSFVGGFSFDKSANNDGAQKQKPMTTSEENIDDIMKRRNDEVSKNKKNQTSVNQAPGSVFNEDEYLKGVLAQTAVVPEKMIASAQLIHDDNAGFMAQVNYEKKKDGSATESDADSGSSYYSNFLPKNASDKKEKTAGKTGRSFEEQVSNVAKLDTKTLNRGMRFYGVLNIGVNTDEISPTTATVIEEGDLLGAEFVAEQPVRAGEKAVITFKSMALRGKDYNVRAIALDPATQRTAIADDVNRHIIERYLSLGIAAFVSGYADTLQDSTSTVSSEGSTTTQKSAITDAGTQMKVAIGKVGEKFSPLFEEGFKRPPTVTVDGNREIVVMLLDPVDVIKE